MPTYSYRCGQCGRTTDAYRPIKDHATGPDCCGASMAQIILPVNIAPVLGGGSFQGYQCVVSDEYVTSRKRRREIMAEHNIIERG